jgi:hypothetical protein
MNPISIPSTATSFLALEQKPGWTKESGPSIETPGQPEPYAWNIIQVTPEPVTPPVTLNLQTQGVKGYYCDWMAKAPTVQVPETALNCLIRTTYEFDSVEGLQAWEWGIRWTNNNGITNNGQGQLVPIGGKLEYDLVPGPSGGWKDTGLRFPMFTVGTLYQDERYWTLNAAGALSQQYIMLNGVLQPIPAALQNIPGANIGWGKNEGVPAFQPDANPLAIAFNPQVTMNVYFW